MCRSNETSTTANELAQGSGTSDLRRIPFEQTVRRWPGGQASEFQQLGAADDIAGAVVPFDEADELLFQQRGIALSQIAGGIEGQRVLFADGDHCFQ